MRRELKDVKEFANEIKNRLEGIYPGTEIRVSEVTKDNDSIKIGISVIVKERDFSPQIYLNELFEEYKSGKRSIDEITLFVQGIFDDQSEKPWCSINLNMLQNWDALKQLVIIRLLGIEKNQEYLKDAVYKEVCDDLAAVAYICFDIQANGITTSKLTKDHFESLGVNKKELFDAALKNTMDAFPANLRGMNETITSMMGSDMFGIAPEEEIMYVLSNNYLINGAVSILYPNILKNFCASHDVDKLVILPSSVHETILVLPGIMMDKDELRNMVMEINDNVVRGGEILSDSVYIYTLENDEIHVLE